MAQVGGPAVPGSVALEVRHAADVGAARRVAREAALQAGLDGKAAEEVALAVAELATNLVRHAGGGRLVLEPLAEGDDRGLAVESVDLGPGIRDLARSMADGYSTAAGLGLGLGTVNRLMDDLRLDSPLGPHGGTRIRCRRWARRRVPATGTCPLAVGAASRCHPACRENGDAFVVRLWSDGALLGVIDGVGHGVEAHRASAAARQYVEAHAERPLDDVFLGTHRACHGTRGVVMALARLRWPAAGQAGAAVLEMANVGNATVRAFGADPPHGVVRRGILGVHAPGPVVTTHAWPRQGVLVLHTDGLKSRWDPADVPVPAGVPPTEVARRLLAALARDDDDATVVVARGVGVEGPFPTAG